MRVQVLFWGDPTVYNSRTFSVLHKVEKEPGLGACGKQNSPPKMNHITG